MTEVYIVYAHLPNGPRYALKAFETRFTANQYIANVMRHPWADDGRTELRSAAQTLGIAAMTVEPLPVEAEVP